MKKILAILIVLTLVLSMGVTAFATVPDPTESEYYDIDSVTFTKTLTAQGLSPAETYSFDVGVGTYAGNVANVTVPTIGDFTISLAQGEASKTYVLELPDFPAAGKYTYPIKETASDTQGMIYDTTQYDFVIQVINNQTQNGFIYILSYNGEGVPQFKVDDFENEFNAGNLVITKDIVGNNAVFTDEFEVTVVLTPEEDMNIQKEPITISNAVNNGTVIKNNDGTVTITFKVKDGSSVTINDIPYGATYVVTEDTNALDADGTVNGRVYVATFADEKNAGDIDATSQTVEITNTLDTEINTGINLDNLPYILILVGAALGLVAFTMKRRLSREE